MFGYMVSRKLDEGILPDKSTAFLLKTRSLNIPQSVYGRYLSWAFREVPEISAGRDRAGRDIKKKRVSGALTARTDPIKEKSAVAYSEHIIL